MALTDPDRLFPVEPPQRDMARAPYEKVADAPILSPHGHCGPRWFAEDTAFANPAELFVILDHYAFRILASQGVPLTDLGVPRIDSGLTEVKSRRIWQHFAGNYHLFRGTSSAMWLEHSFEHVFGLAEPLTLETAEIYYDHINACLARKDFRPRALFERFNVEAFATTEGALDDLRWHQAIKDSAWSGRMVTTYRPDALVDPKFEGFVENIKAFGALTGEDTSTWAGYLNAHRVRRAFFKTVGAMATDHGHATARTENLSVK